MPHKVYFEELKCYMQLGAGQLHTNAKSYKTPLEQCKLKNDLGAPG